MIVVLATIGGVWWGAYLARKRKGGRLDIAQYAGSFAIAFGVLGLFLTIALDWLV